MTKIKWRVECDFLDSYKRLSFRSASRRDVAGSVIRIRIGKSRISRQIAKRRSLGCKIINERMDSIDINYIERALYFFWQCLYTRTHIHTHIHTYLLASFLISLFLSLSLSKLSRFLPPNNTFTRLSYFKVLLLLLWDIFTLSNVVSFFLSRPNIHQQLPSYKKITPRYISSLCPTEQSHDTVDICHNEAAVITRYFSLWTYMNTHFSYTINWFKVDASKSDKCVRVCVVYARLLKLLYKK